MSYKVRANDQLGYMFDFGPASETLDDAKQKITDTKEILCLIQKNIEPDKKFKTLKIKKTLLKIFKNIY